MPEQIVQLLHEEVRDPEVGVEALLAEVRGVAVADLVVEDDRDVVRGGGEVGEGKQVVVAGAGAAVEDDKGAPGRGGGQVAIHLVPGLAGLVGGGDVKGDFAFGCFGGLARHGGFVGDLKVSAIVYGSLL